MNTKQRKENNMSKLVEVELVNSYKDYEDWNENFNAFSADAYISINPDNVVAIMESFEKETVIIADNILFSVKGSYTQIKNKFNKR